MDIIFQFFIELTFLRTSGLTAQAGVRISAMDLIECAGAQSRARRKPRVRPAIRMEQRLEGLSYQTGVARCGDVKPSDAPDGTRNVEEILATNPIAEIEVCSHGGSPVHSGWSLGQAVETVPPVFDGRFLGNQDPRMES